MLEELKEGRVARENRGEIGEEPGKGRSGRTGAESGEEEK